MALKNYRNESRENWGCENVPNLEQLKFGALQRIADASELMAKNHQQLIDERDRYKKWYELNRDTNFNLRKQISGLRGYITRLKKRIKK